MTQYLEHGFTLTERQLKQIATAAKKEKSLKLKLDHDQLVGDHKLLVTKTQDSQIAKNYNGGMGILLELSAKQLKKPISGGVLPLLALLPLIFGGLGAAGGVAGGVSAAVQAANSKAAAAAAQRELERHNRELEAQAQAAVAQGTGLTAKKGKGKSSYEVKSKSKAVTENQQQCKACPTCKGTGLFLGKQ
jgi:hypothetical protein